MAVILKSVLFAIFERRLPRLRAAWRMFLGNVLTSFVGLVVAMMIASAPSAWFIGVPVVCFLCWLPARRLVKSRSVGMAGPNIAWFSCWDHECCNGGELYFVHGWPRGTRGASTCPLLDPQARGNLAGSVRQHYANHRLGRMGDLAAEFTPGGARGSSRPFFAQTFMFWCW